MPFATDGARAPLSHARPKVAQGFTLLEALIALIIASFALAVLFRSEVDGLREAHVASRYEQAVARANSRLALAVHSNPLVAGDWQGEDGDGFRWRVHVAPIVTIIVEPVYRPVSRVTENNRVALYAVTVWIAWHDDGTREVRLDTEQIGPGAQ